MSPSGRSTASAASGATSAAAPAATDPATDAAAGAGADVVVPPSAVSPTSKSSAASQRVCNGCVGSGAAAVTARLAELFDGDGLVCSKAGAHAAHNSTRVASSREAGLKTVLDALKQHSAAFTCTEARVGEPGQLHRPLGVVVTGDSRLVVLDGGSPSAADSRLVRYNLVTMSMLAPSSLEAYGPAPVCMAAMAGTGSKLALVESLTPTVAVLQPGSFTGEVLRRWGSAGSGPADLSSPGAVAVAPDDLVVVADTGNDRISVFRPDGTFVRTFTGGDAGEPWAARQPVSVACTPLGGVAVVCRESRFVRLYSQHGQFLRMLGPWPEAEAVDSTESHEGSDAVLHAPVCVACAPDGRLFVADAGEEGASTPFIAVFSARGHFLSTFTLPPAFKPLSLAFGHNERPVSVTSSAGILLPLPFPVFIVDGAAGAVAKFETPADTEYSKWEESLSKAVGPSL